MIKISINSPLQERDTDPLYGSFSNYLAKLLREHKYHVNLRIHPLRVEEGVIYFPMVLIYYQPGRSWKDEYQEYQDFIKLTSEKNIFEGWEHFSRVVSSLVIFLCPGNMGTSLGSMDDRGTLRIYLQPWKSRHITETEGLEHKILKPEDIERLFGEVGRQNIERIVELVSKNVVITSVESTFAHELGHFKNLVRAKGVGWRSKGQSKMKKSDVAYARSPEEWQARYTQLFHSMDKVARHAFPDLDRDLADLDGGKVDLVSLKQKYREEINRLSESSPEGVVMLFRYLDVNDFQSFYEMFIHALDVDSYIKKLDRKGMNRLRLRVHSAYETYSKLKHLPIFKVFDLMKRR